MLVLDRSGSINDNGSANYENAALAFVNDLVGTNTEIGIVSFAATASASRPWAPPTRTSRPATAARHVIANVYDNLGGGTNWDGGLQLAATRSTPTRTWSSSSRTATRPPTIYRAVATSTGEVNWDDYTEAVTSANRLKAGDGAGPQPESRVFAIGAGAAGTISEENFWGVAGPVTDQANILANDYLVGSADELGDALRALALARLLGLARHREAERGRHRDLRLHGQRLGPRALHPQHRGRQPHDQRPLRLHRPQFGVKYVQEPPEPGWTLTNIACTDERRRHHHRHRQRLRLRLAGRPPASTRATPP